MRINNKYVSSYAAFITSFQSLSHIHQFHNCKFKVILTTHLAIVAKRADSIYPHHSYSEYIPSMALWGRFYYDVPLLIFVYICCSCKNVMITMW